MSNRNPVQWSDLDSEWTTVCKLKGWAVVVKCSELTLEVIDRLAAAGVFRVHAEEPDHFPGKKWLHLQNTVTWIMYVDTENCYFHFGEHSPGDHIGTILATGEIRTNIEKTPRARMYRAIVNWWYHTHG
jgi:hypothetical protein